MNDISYKVLKLRAKINESTHFSFATKLVENGECTFMNMAPMPIRFLNFLSPNSGDQWYGKVVAVFLIKVTNEK